MTEEPLLEMRSLAKYFEQETRFLKRLFGGDEEQVQAVDGVSLSLHENESQGIIGESGCGKTTLLKTLIGIHSPTSGEIRYRGTPVQEFDKADWKAFRKNVQLIFQDPYNSFDPKMKIRETLLEPLQIHGVDDRTARLESTLRDVELDPPDQYLDRYPGQLSGGELQRVSIARALILEPDIILADEPVSMLDVSTQAAILNLLSELIEKYGVSMLYISHDLSTVSYVCDMINVMYLGRIVESARTEPLLEDPKHPYSKALISAVPIPDPYEGRFRTELEGAVQNPVGMGEGCRFRDRCPERMEICERTPLMLPLEDNGREVACHLYYDHEEREQMNQSDGLARSGTPMQ